MEANICDGMKMPEAEEAASESDDSRNKLRISLTPERTSDVQMTLRSHRKRKRNEPKIDRAFEEKLLNCAKKKNLSPTETQMLLKKVVENDHVLALVKIQEESKLASAQDDRRLDLITQSSTELENDVRPPKYTRSKTRALNMKPFPVSVLSEIEPEPDVAALVSEELHPDEEDEEYQPRDEEYASDDDLNTTVSDIESQPCTPQTPATQCEQSEEDQQNERYTEDGLFKLPHERNDSIVSHQEEIIAKRTRSKVCLQATPIETIESNFIPPDITTDMYDFDGEMDIAWKEFLNEFTKPLNTNAEEVDDEADPEYIAADHEPIDSEELRDVNISKKELSDLVAELFDGLVQEGVILDDIVFDTPKKSNDKGIQKKRTKVDSIDGSQLHLTQSNAMTVFSPDVVSTPNQHSNQPLECVTSVLPNPTSILEVSSQEPLEATSQGCTSGTAITKTARARQYVMTSRGYEPLVDAIDLSTEKSLPHSVAVSNTNLVQSVQVLQNNSLGSLASAKPITLIPIFSTLPPSARNVIVSSNTSSSSASTPVYQIIPATQYPVIVPYSNLTFNQSTKLLTDTIIGDGKGPNPDTKKSLSRYGLRSYTDENRSLRSRLREDYAVKYEKLKTIEAPEEPLFPENQKGFTEHQRKILDQQMRIHVQFCAQNFLQVYCHPEFWKYAEIEKNMIVELTKNKNQMEERSAFNICNLEPALKLITDWEKELSVCSPKNTALMEFIYKEIEVSKRRTNHLKYVTRFPPRIMKRILRSPVFIYGQLLPAMPFRPSPSNFYEMLPVLDQLIAHALHSIYNELNEYERRVHPRKKKEITLTRVCRYLVRDHIFGKSVSSLNAHIRKRADDPNYNPIKYYYEHKKPPPYKHVLYDTDLHNIALPEDRVSDLPSVWQEFVNWLHASEIEEKESSKHCKKSVDAVYNYTDSEIDDCSTTHTISNTPNITIHLNYVQHQTNSTQSCNKSSIVHNSGDLDDGYRNRNTWRAANQEKALSRTDYSYVFTKIHEPLQSTHLSNTVQFYKVGNNFTSSSESRASSISPPLFHPNDSLRDFSSPNVERSCITQSTPALLNNVKPIHLAPKIAVDEKPELAKGQKLLTDYFKFENPKKKRGEELSKATQINRFLRRHRKRFVIRKSTLYRKRIFHKNRIAVRKKRHKKFLKRKIQTLLVSYRSSFRTLCNRYQNDNVRRVFRCFKALDIYTDLLIDLKMNAKKLKTAEDGTAARKLAQSKAAGDDENPKQRKPYRVGEKLRQMLLPETNEDINEKDAVFAMNFFNKVEEIFSTENCEMFGTFQKILRSFDPKKDRVADLYYKMENLFLPDYPDLAEVFLTFLLPSEAIEIGKFFEHFMITNMGSFINKLNIFFNKPGQIKKIYGALNELAKEKDVTIEQVKAKILPLLKGNTFLVDWFLQTFEKEKPNQSISTIYETVSLKQMESQLSDGEVYETILQKDIVSDTNENHPCQFKYINGSLFYGSRILLPAKLSFLATELMKNEKQDSAEIKSANNTSLIGLANPCVHGIRDYGEKRLKSHLDKSDVSEKAEDENNIDKQTYTLCDNATFKAHAARLNPALYQSPSNHHTTNTLKSKSSDAERELKSSPKKQCIQKRRSPKKSLTKSPTAVIKKSTTSIQLPGDSSRAICMAKKLKSITSGSESDVNAGVKSKRKQQKSQKLSNVEQVVESSGNQPSLHNGTSDTDKPPMCDPPKRKQMKSQCSPNADDSLHPLHLPIHHSTVISSSSIESSSCTSLGSDVIEVKNVVVWTRDEDKIILEELKSGFISEGSLVSKLALKLPHRREVEIRNRHHFLMEVLTQLQGKVMS